jgi:hypothetical protein
MPSAVAKLAYTADMTLASIVQEVVDAFLRAVDGEAPGLVEGLTSAARRPLTISVLA